MTESISRTSPDWHDHVMEQFVTGELSNGHPTCSGLRRVFEALYAEIIECQTMVIKTPTQEDPTATVWCSISCVEHDTGKTRRQDCSADVSPYNTEALFAKHPVSTAETRAEARALRKLLGLKVISAEEAESGSISVKMMNGQLKRGIENTLTVLKKTGLAADTFLAQHCGVTEEQFRSNGEELVSESQSKTILEALNSYQDNGIPEEFIAKTT